MDPFRTVAGRVEVLDRHNVDTDQIIPKQFLKRIERTGFGRYLFHDWRESDELELDPTATILVSGHNFGCGSSREHAPWALQDFGYRAIVAPSFADIFYVNCHKIGLLPVVLEEEEVWNLMEAEEATVDLERLTVSFSGREVPFEKDPELRRRLLHGLDDIEITLESVPEIDDYERSRARPLDTLAVIAR